MHDSQRIVILALLISAAIGCYIFGSNTGMFGFIIIGGIFELAFWFGLFSDDTTSEDS